MRNQRQGVQSTKVRSSQLPTQQRSEATLRLEENQRDVFLEVLKPKENFYMEQTGNFPHQSIMGNRYQMILHKIYGNFTWIEPMKNKTEGEMILARRRALARMKHQ